MSIIGRPWQWLVSGMLALILVVNGLLAASPAGAQEMECDTDPGVSIRASDGNMINVKVHYKASLRLPDGTVVAMSDMATHLLTKTARPAMSATKKGKIYEVKVTSVTEHWLAILPFTVKSYLVHTPTGIVGPTASGLSKTQITATVSLPAGTSTVVTTADGW